MVLMDRMMMTGGSADLGTASPGEAAETANVQEQRKMII